MDWVKNPVDNVTSAPWDAAGHTFNNFGRYGDPVYAGAIQTPYGDFWPGYYSKTHVGALSRDCRAVMAGIRAGRIWVAHGDLIRGLEVRVRTSGGDRSGVTLGGQLRVRRGATVEVSMRITLAGTPNFAQLVPTLSRVDMITGTVTGGVTDRDSFTTPDTRVAKSWEVGRNSGSVRQPDLGAAAQPGPLMAGTILGVDAGSPTAADAEHLLRRWADELGADPGTVLCTHAVRLGTPHYAGTLAWTGPLPVIPDAGVALSSGLQGGDPALAAGALHAARERAGRAAGRAVRFPGMELLTGTVPVADVLARTAIERVVVLAGGALSPDARLRTRDFVRPEWRDGTLILLVLPAAGGLLAPFEVPDPKPCCTSHS